MGGALQISNPEPADLLYSSRNPSLVRWTAAGGRAGPNPAHCMLPPIRWGGPYRFQTLNLQICYTPADFLTHTKDSTGAGRAPPKRTGSIPGGPPVSFHSHFNSIGYIESKNTRWPRVPGTSGPTHPRVVGPRVWRAARFDLREVLASSKGQCF